MNSATGLHGTNSRGRVVRSPARCGIAGIIALALCPWPRQAVALETRISVAGEIVRPADTGLTSFWSTGAGAVVGFELLPGAPGHGIALWLEHAVLPARPRASYPGDTLEVLEWGLTTVLAGARRHWAPISSSPGLALLGELAIGYGWLDFGEVRVRSRVSPQFYPADLKTGTLFSLAAGAEFVGEPWGLFFDTRLVMYLESQTYTWNSTRIGLVLRVPHEPR